MAAKITQGFTCPCGAWTKVLSTRMGKIRRRECANLHRFYTEEKILGPSNIKLKESDDGIDMEMCDTSGEEFDEA